MVGPQEESVYLDSVLIYWQRQMNASYGIIGALIMLFYNSHEHTLIYAQVVFIMFTQVIYTVI